ncbi:MAG: efflux RND transporter periplasmic adaptor subunit [Clostridia bacterium]
MGNRRALKWLAQFFVLMLGLTLVARAADTLTIAGVTAGTSKRGALTHKALVDAQVEAEDSCAVWVEADLGVERVPVKVGTRVKAGDALARFSSVQVRRALSERQLALDKLKNSRAQAALGEPEAAADDKDKGQKDEKAKAAAHKARKDKLILAALDQEIRAASEALERLVALYRDDCQVLSPLDGVVTQLNLRAGERTTGNAAALIAGEQRTLSAVVELSQAQGRFVAAGDVAQVTRSGKQSPSEATVRSVSPADNQGVMRATIDLSGAAYTVGETVSVQFSQKTDVFGKCVPLSALHGDSAGDYVLVIRERNGVLGVNQVASRVNVTVLDRDGSRAAIEGSLTQDDRIIEKSDKAISDGDRVRCTAP